MRPLELVCETEDDNEKMKNENSEPLDSLHLNVDEGIERRLRFEDVFF